MLIEMFQWREKRMHQILRIDESISAFIRVSIRFHDILEIKAMNEKTVRMINII